VRFLRKQIAIWKRMTVLIYSSPRQNLRCWMMNPESPWGVLEEDESRAGQTLDYSVVTQVWDQNTPPDIPDVFPTYSLSHYRTKECNYCR
jgi:hypothetical protein